MNANKITQRVASRFANRDADADYKKRSREVRQTLKNIEKRLNVHDKKQSRDPKNWGYVGNMGHIKELLEEVASFIGQ